MVPSSISVAAVSTEEWEKDEQVKSCRTCTSEFGLFTRKHHCRVCGRVFCAACTEETLMVENFAAPQRCCFECFVQHTAMSEAEVAMAEANASKYSESWRLCQRLLIVEAKTRSKGSLLIGNTALLFVPRGNTKKSIVPYSLVDLVRLAHPTGSNRLEIYFHHLYSESVLVVEGAEIPALITVLRTAHRDLLGGTTSPIRLDISSQSLLPLPQPLESYLTAEQALRARYIPYPLCYPWR